MTDPAILQTRLTEAEAARHKLVTGTLAVSLGFGDLGSTTYATADLNRLDGYIASLRSQLSTVDGIPQNRRRPIHMSF